MTDPRITGLWLRIQDLFAQATRDPRMGLLVGTAIALLVALVVVVGFMMLSPRKRRVRKIYRIWEPLEGEAEDEDEDEVAAEIAEPDATDVAATPAPAVEEVASRARWRKVRATIGALTAPLIVIGAVAFTYVATGTDQFCYQTCHASEQESVMRAKRDHNGAASCTDCHEDPSPTGVIGNSVERARMAYVALLKGNPAGTVRLVDSASCERCHEEDIQGVADVEAAGVRISHAEPLGAGMNCVDCHVDTGHVTKRNRPGVPMRTCIGCHDDQKASATCTTCHLTDIALSGSVDREQASEGGSRLGTGRYLYPPVVAGDNSCYGCHESAESRCDKCHGLRMPHSAEFKSGYHAKPAAFEKKKMCYRCHDKRHCQRCHLPFEGAHLEGWKERHKTVPWDSGCSCHARGTNEDIPICVFCHDDAPARKVAPPVTR